MRGRFVLELLSALFTLTLGFLVGLGVGLVQRDAARTEGYQAGYGDGLRENPELLWAVERHKRAAQFGVR